MSKIMEEDKVPKSNSNNMDKEDEEYLKNISSHTPDEIRKGKNVINQKNLFEFFINMRISLQKIIQSVNQLPPSEALKNFIDDSNSQVLKKTLLELVTLLNTSLCFFRELIRKKNYGQNNSDLNLDIITDSFDNQIESNQEYIKSLSQAKSLDLGFIEEIIESMKDFCENIFSITEKIINIWYKKALVYSHKSNQKVKILKILNNSFCEHIKKNLNVALPKSKRRKENKPNKFSNDFNYEDDDFYNYLLKEFIINKDLTQTEENTNSNRMDLTLQYLFNRKKDKKDKNVDTRASKNRKLKFEKHEKLINFMIPLLNSRMETGRNDFINSIFGLGRRTLHEVDVDSDFEII